MYVHCKPPIFRKLTSICCRVHIRKPPRNYFQNRLIKIKGVWISNFQTGPLPGEKYQHSTTSLTMSHQSECCARVFRLWKTSKTSSGTSKLPKGSVPKMKHWYTVTLENERFSVKIRITDYNGILGILKNVYIRRKSVFSPKLTSIFYRTHFRKPHRNYFQKRLITVKDRSNSQFANWTLTGSKDFTHMFAY